ncbi:MAG TPA: class I SAM-dependent methyltransferase [Tepidisphaeraceae bacterium]|jgi:SAM-dependent methyltransferase
MKLTEEHVRRLEDFLERIKNETYPEPRSPVHDQVTAKMLPQVMDLTKLPEGSTILDVGCGQGVALEHFRQRKMNAIGITINPEDMAACTAQGYDVREMDQSFLDFPDETFDLVWCRHTLEHSIFPYFTLSELRRVLKPMGWLYVEIPAPDTAAQHQTNRNHYSVLGRSLWADLIMRSGHDIVGDSTLGLELAVGKDEYWAFVARRRD